MIFYLINLLVLITSQKQMLWKGITWNIKESLTQKLGPGPNYWAGENIYVDENDYLHIKIKKVNNEWACAQIWSEQLFQFGTFEWQLIGRVDAFDKNVVLGLFTYPPDAKTGPDGSNEIDIEFSKWNGQSNANNLYYTLFPRLDDKGKLQPSISNSTKFSLIGTYTTHRFIWDSQKIVYQSMDGHYQDETNQFFKWQTPASKVSSIPLSPLSLHINLWLFQTTIGPSDQQQVEVIINDFRYKKLAVTQTPFLSSV